MTDGLGLADFLAEDKNDIGVTTLTDKELDGIISEVDGLDETDQQRIEFVGRAAKASTVKSTSGVVHTKNLTAKAEYEKRINLLPSSIRKKLANRQLKIVDAAYYVTLNIGGIQQVELLQNQDVKVVGKTNINNRKLGITEYFLCTEIQMQSAVNANASAAAYGVPSDIIKNGEFRIDVGSTKVIPVISCSVFNTSNRNDVKKGAWRLDNPKFFTPESEIVAELKLPVAAPVNTCVKLILVGATLEKY